MGGGGKGRSGGVAEGNKGVKGVRLRGGGQVEERWDGEWWWAGGGGGGGEYRVRSRRGRWGEMG